MSARLIAIILLAACSREPSSKPVPVAVKENTAPTGSAATPTPPPQVTRPRGLTPGAKIRSYDDLVLVDLSPDDGPLREQLLGWAGNSVGRTFMVETTATWCRPCIGFAKYASDPQMTKALAGVTLARIDIDQFAEAALTSAGLSASSVPWFVMFDDKLEIKDAITSGEWEDDVPANMAPVLGAFARGTFTNRKYGKH